MNGPEHFAEAERLLASITAEFDKATSNTIGEVIELAPITAATAQAHATLAVAYGLGVRAPEGEVPF